MDTDRLNRWLTLVANVGVVIGLAVLIYEIRASQHLAETQALVRGGDRIQVAQVQMAVSESLAAIRVKALREGVKSLTDVELYRLQTWERAVRNRMSSQYIEYLRGYTGESSANLIVETAVRLLPYWEELGYELGDGPFSQAVKEAAGT